MYISSGPRASGRTTKQMMNAENGAFFVCPSHTCIREFSRLATACGREDLKIVSHGWLNTAIGRSCRVIVDHATYLDEEQWGIVAKLNHGWETMNAFGKTPLVNDNLVTKAEGGTDA